MLSSAACQALLGREEILKLALSIPRDHTATSHPHEVILALVSNVSNSEDIEEACIFEIQRHDDRYIVESLVPVYPDFEATIEQVPEPTPSSPLDISDRPPQNNFRVIFSSNKGNDQISVVTDDISQLDDLRNESKRLSSIAKQHNLRPGISHAWVFRYSVPASSDISDVLASTFSEASTTSASESLSSILDTPKRATASGGNASFIEGLPSIGSFSSLWSSFGTATGSSSTLPYQPRVRAVPSASSVFSTDSQAPLLDDETAKRLAEMKPEYTSEAKLKIHVCSFNASGAFSKPDEPWKEWLKPEGAPDVVAVGLQEMDLRPETLLWHDPSVASGWSDTILSTLQDGSENATYVSIAEKQLAGMWIALFARKELQQDISDVATTSVATGWAGLAGNKGSCAIRLRIYDTPLVFVCAHLAAFQDQAERRNADFVDISQRTVFSTSSSQSPLYPTSGSYASIDDSAATFFFGDLNYRINLPRDSMLKALSSHPYSTILKAHDQLKIAQDAGLAFQDYQEHEIGFSPTYKYDKGTDDFDSSEKARSPAWTDRVLWKVQQAGRENGVKVKCEGYESVMGIRMSDHKPVSARFSIELQRIDKRKMEEVLERLRKEKS